MPELLDVRADEVRVFDVVDEGLTVVEIAIGDFDFPTGLTWPYRTVERAMGIELHLAFVTVRHHEVEGVPYPVKELVWNGGERRLLRPDQIIRVARGMPEPPPERSDVVPHA